MEFVNLINSDGLVKQEMQGVVSKNTPLSPIIKHGHVTNRGNISALETEHLSGGKTRVLLHKDGSDVVKIEFVCNCGETVTIDVDYPDTGMEH